MFNNAHIISDCTSKKSKTRESCLEVCVWHLGVADPVPPNKRAKTLRSCNSEKLLKDSNPSMPHCRVWPYRNPRTNQGDISLPPKLFVCHIFSQLLGHVRQSRAAGLPLSQKGHQAVCVTVQFHLVHEIRMQVVQVALLVNRRRQKHQLCTKLPQQALREVTPPNVTDPAQLPLVLTVIPLSPTSTSTITSSRPNATLLTVLHELQVDNY